MNVEQASVALRKFVRDGYGKCVLRAYDPESEDFEAITGFIYGGKENPIDVQTDSDEEEDIRGFVRPQS